jgi:hypothetical protein
MITRFNYLAATGNANTLVAGSFINGPTLKMGRAQPGTLSAQVDVDVETASLTFALHWQGSNAADFSNPTDLAFTASNEAATVIATGTGGADASVKKAYQAPASAYGFKYVRCRLLTAGATGNTVDTYSMGYNFKV